MLEDIEKPVPGDDELLVRVRAAAVNPHDWHYMRGTPYIMRLDTGLRKPEVLRLGVDFAAGEPALLASMSPSTRMRAQSAWFFLDEMRRFVVDAKVDEGVEF